MMNIKIALVALLFFGISYEFIKADSVERSHICLNRNSNITTTLSKFIHNHPVLSFLGVCCLSDHVFRALIGTMIVYYIAHEYLNDNIPHCQCEVLHHEIHANETQVASCTVGIT